MIGIINAILYLRVDITEMSVVTTIFLAHKLKRGSKQPILFPHLLLMLPSCWRRWTFRWVSWPNTGDRTTKNNSSHFQPEPKQNSYKVKSEYVLNQEDT
jgi:hypothetical protein